MLRALLLCLLAGLAHAEPSPRVQAEALLAKLSGLREASLRFQIANEAEELCEKAIAERPRDPLPRITLARALTVADLAHPEACRPGRCERAVDELKKARVLDNNGVEAEHIASELGIVLSRLGRFEEALAEYDRALRLVEADRRPNQLDQDDKAVLYGNSAETLMALGRLDEAIERYRLAEAASNPGDVEWQLAEWGLGVALDRDEQVEKSRAAISHAIEASSNMAPLSEDGVFFEPAGDKLYYLALGFESAGDRKEAVNAWNDYLATKPNPRWARRARAHLESLKKGIKLEPAEPTVEVIFGRAEVDRPLRTPDQLAATLAEHAPDLRRCYLRALRINRRPGPSVVRLALELSPPGWPMRPVRVAGRSPTEDPGFLRCIETAAMNWRFPSVDVDLHETLAVPITFEIRQ